VKRKVMVWFFAGGETRDDKFNVFSRKFKGPSFLNTHPQKGHIHRRRSQTVRKALDFIDILLVRHNLAGDYYRERAKEVINQESGKV
jgi:hypothetical protein